MCPLSARQASDVLGNMASAASSWRSMRQRDKNHRTQKPRLVFAFVRCLKEWRREDVSWNIDLQATLGISSLSQPDLASWHHWQTKVPLAADVTVSSQTLTWQGGWWWVRNRLFRDSRRAFFVFFIFFSPFYLLFFSHVCHGPCIPRRVPSNRQKQGGWFVGLNEVMKLPTIVCRRVARAGLEEDVQRSNDHHLERIKMASLLQTTMLFCWSARISLFFFPFSFPSWMIVCIHERCMDYFTSIFSYISQLL